MFPFQRFYKEYRKAVNEVHILQYCGNAIVVLPPNQYAFSVYDLYILFLGFLVGYMQTSAQRERDKNVSAFVRGMC